jgi:hypothetical protein
LNRQDAKAAKKIKSNQPQRTQSKTKGTIHESRFTVFQSRQGAKTPKNEGGERAHWKVNPQEKLLMNGNGASLMPGFEKILPQYGLLRSSRAGRRHRLKDEG